MSERFESGYLNSTPSFVNSTLGVLTYRPESHVAQQRRRDKLRTPQTVTPSHHSHDIPNHLLQLPSESGLNPDLVQVRSVTNCDSLYYPPMFSSEMLNFSMNSHVLMGHKDAQQEPSGAQSSRPTGPDDVPFGGNSSKITGPQNPCHWKGIGSQPSCDWIVNYVSGSGGNAPLFVGETLPGNLKEPNLSSSAMFMNADGCNGYQDVQSSVTNASNGELNFGSPSLYHSALQEVVTSSTMGRQGFDMASLGQQNNRESSHCAWVDGGDEPVVLPIYGNHFGAPRVNDSDSWMHRQEEGSNNQWNDELGFGNGRSGRQLDRAAGESTSRGLSLSLSSHAPSKHNVAFGERFVSENLQSRGEMCSGSQDSRPNSAGYLCSGSKPSVGNPFHGMAGSSVYPRRSIGPLGPFTGYATVLKNSKYLQPAQQLLDDICTVTGSKLIRTCGSSERGSREVSNSSEHINAGNEVRGMGESSDVSSFNSSNQAGGDGRSGTGPCQSYHPEFQQKKAKLLYMQEEVCRRYKQYHQQMQMVVSSFESVAGLSCATPYTSLALKAVTRHFRCLKNAISDQIKHITKTLGDEFLSPMDGTISKGDSTVHKLRSIDQNLRKQQAGGDRIGFIDTRAPQHPIWRPQRGLPERAVTVLRAWLFEHFLHPYPTDTDKHMLATQTGLSRNQVSNWFINARVRVWKPMVEEMHNLEKGSTETDHASGINYQNPNNDSNAGCSNDQSSNKLMIDAMSDKPPESLSIQPVPAEVGESSEQWFREKRSRVEHPIPPDVDSGLIGFVPYHHNGLGAVSLTLGLQHNTDHHHQQQQQQQQQQLRHYGGQIFHDYMG